jgi:hypothetical protein
MERFRGTTGRRLEKADDMIELILPPNYSGPLMAKCSEHGLILGPKRTDAPGKLTIVWRCTACDARARPEAKQAETVKEIAGVEVEAMADG